jgi:Protein of unknown function (DUF2505)
MGACRVRFHAEHRFNGPPRSVASILSDPDFYVELDLPDLSRPEVLAITADDEGTSVRLRYEFEGRLDPVAKRLLGGRTLAWIQEVRLDPSGTAGRLDFGAEADARRLHGSATFLLEQREGETARNLHGEIKVSVPGVGGMAERRIVPGLLRRMDIEAEALNDRLVEG